MNRQSDNPDNSDQSSKEEVPGRTTGFLIMTAMIVFVALFMSQQSRQSNSGNDNVDPANALPGFRADAWYLPGTSRLGFVEIPAGTFIMGSNPALDRMAYENERWSGLQRQGEPELPAFLIARFETTQAQFNAFVRDTGLAQEAVNTDKPGNYPVSNVTWPEALAYTRWLERQLRNSPLTPPALKQLLDNGGHVTLPTEAEWEKAARGSDGRIFPWGAQPRTDFANFNGGSVQAVGTNECPACAHDLADMAGNVWELTRSPMQEYPYDSTDDDELSGGDPLYVMRGGSYADAVNNVRTAVRGAVDPGVRSDTIGFRVVISRR